MTPRPYIICTNIRSGSNLLCRSLSKLGGLGNPTELFHPNLRQQYWSTAEQLRGYLNRQMKSDIAQHGAFGVKLHWYQLQNMLTVARGAGDQPDHALLGELIPDAQLVFLFRRDVAAQAVSAFAAQRTGLWELAATEAEQDKAKALRPSLLNIARIYEWEEFLAT